MGLEIHFSEYDMKEFKNFINGEYVANASGKTYENRNPVDNSLIGLVYEAGKPEVDAAVAAAKAALHAMSKNLAQELGPAGVTVNTISPSMIDTDLVANAPDRIRQTMIGRTPLRRLGTPEDVAGAVLLLAGQYGG